MAFFLIVPCVMVVSVILIHALAKRLGLRIYYTTLIAVAVLSFMVVFASALVSPDAAGKAYLLRLALIIFAISLLVTLANRFLIKKQQDEERRFTEEVKAAYAAEIQKDSPTLTETAKPLDKFEWGESDDDFNKINRYNENVDEPPDAKETVAADEKLSDAKETVAADEKLSDVEETVAADEKLSDAEETVAADEKVSDVEETVAADEKLSDVEETVAADEKLSDVEETVTADPSGKFPLDKVFKPLAEVKPEEADKPVDVKEKPDPAENFPLNEVFQPLAEVKPEEADKPIEQPEQPKHVEFFPLQEVFEPLSLFNLDKIEELTQEEKDSPHEEPIDVEDIGTLDEILDRAYNERAKGHVWQAIALYETALERYRNDEYAPFVAIDLGNIYKEEALYSKAVKIYEDALTLPAIKRNASIRKEFVNNLEYLRVVRDVLLKHQLLSKPFAQLPKEILQEIDTTFQKVQNLGARDQSSMIV